MCYYITATLPKGTKLDSLKPILEKFAMDFSLLKNPNITSQLRPDEIYLRATKSYCDCNTTLGSRSITPEYNKILKSQKVRSLRKNLKFYISFILFLFLFSTFYLNTKSISVMISKIDFFVK